MDQWSEDYTQSIYAKTHKKCLTDVLLISARHPELSMQMIMRVANIMDAYALPIRTPLSHTMNGAFLCSGLGVVSHLENSCRPNANYILENTQVQKRLHPLLECEANAFTAAHTR
jgi:hypothetical protein